MVFDRHTSVEYVLDMNKLRILREQKKLSQAQLAERVGTSQPQIKRLEDGERKLTKEWAERIAPHLDVSAESLLFPDKTESGWHKPSLVSSYDPDHDNGYSGENWKPSIEGAIPEIDVKLGAGQGAVGEVLSIGNNDEKISAHRVIAEWVLSEAFVKHELRASPKTTVIMEVIGDSMTPTYQPGDRVIVNLAQTEHITDTVYAISDGYGEPQIKRLQRIPFTDPARVKIISDNPNLETFEVELAMIRIIGRISGHIARK